MSLHPLDLITIVSSALLAGLVAARVTSHAMVRRLNTAQAAQERARWRDAIRLIIDRLILAAHHHDVVEVKQQAAQLAMHLNPLDAEDNAIVELAKQLAKPTHLAQQIQALIDRAALLLHHDGRGVQQARSLWPLRNKEPQRVPHSEFKQVVAGVSASKPTASKALAAYFGMLMLSSAILFFLAAGLTEPFLELVNIFDETKTEKSMSAWLLLVALSVLVGAFWSAVYLWFKACEKRFLDLWLSK